MVKKINFILFFICLSIHCYSQINVTAALDSNTILLGDQVWLNFRTTQAVGNEYLSADFRAALDTIEQIELLEVKDPTTTSLGTNEVVTQSILITSFEDGNHQIPSINFSSKGNSVIYNNISNPVYLLVQPIVIDTTAQLKPIKDIIAEPVLVSDWIHYILIPLGLLIALGLIIFLIVRLSKKRTVAPIVEKKVYIPPHVVALKKMEELKARELWQKGEVKAYYSEISYIAREYLENRYNINALESVTDEITLELKDKDIPEVLQKRLLDTLRTSDLVKFAKVKPNEESHQNVWDRAVQFIKETLYIAPPPSEIEENNPQENT